MPCYIPSKRILREGGYEAEDSLWYYDRPARLAPESEDLIIKTVHEILPKQFVTDLKKANSHHRKLRRKRWRHFVQRQTWKSNSSRADSHCRSGCDRLERGRAFMGGGDARLPDRHGRQLQARRARKGIVRSRRRREIRGLSLVSRWVAFSDRDHGVEQGRAGLRRAGYYICRGHKRRRQGRRGAHWCYWLRDAQLPGARERIDMGA